MKLKLRYRLNVRPDKNGEYPEVVAQRLIAANLADPVVESRGKRK